MPQKRLAVAIAVLTVVVAVSPVGFNFCKCAHRHELYFSWDYLRDIPHGHSVLPVLVSAILALVAAYYALAAFCLCGIRRSASVGCMVACTAFSVLPRLAQVVLGYVYLFYRTTALWQLELSVVAIIATTSVVLQGVYYRRLRTQG